MDTPILADELPIIDQAIAEGEIPAAIRGLGQFLGYPGHIASEDEWSALLQRLAAAVRHGGIEALTSVAEAATEDSRHTGVLYHLGYQLLEVDLPSIAATILQRALDLKPGSPEILSELASALETAGHNAEVVRLLQSQPPKVLAENPILRFLIAFNALMTGDLEIPRQILPTLQVPKKSGFLGGLLQRKSPEADEGVQFVAGRIARMLGRADAITGTSRLDEQDRRGWHYVLTGTVLLYECDGGRETMAGRFGGRQDSPAQVHEALQRLKAVLDAWNWTAPRIWSLPERGSQILATAAGQVLGRPVKPWPKGGSSEPGLIVAYRLQELDGPTLQSLVSHKAGQLLWSHVTTFTQSFPIAADITTLLAQVDWPMWGKQAGLMRNPETGLVETVSREDAAVTEIAAEIVEAEVDDASLADLPQLTAMVRKAVSGAPLAPAPHQRPTGSRREMQPDDTMPPVARFG